MLLGIDIGFGFTKTITRFGADAFPSVVGDWTPPEVHIGGFDPADPEALRYEGRQYLVAERALKLASRRFVDLSREWLDTVLMAPGERVAIAFVADNPGDWMFHCHILEHQLGGMMGSVRVS